MNIYNTSSEQTARLFTENYSSSFSSASKFFSQQIRQDIYNLYGMVRVADEIVDNFRPDDTDKLLLKFIQEIEIAQKIKFSTNPIIHAFADTANKYKIDSDLIDPFFASMKMDIAKKIYNQQEYSQYIYGSAEVIGLMCLRIFCANNETLYKQLAQGARKLGSAYQKVNFLRDLENDYNKLGRWYFPFSSYDAFNNDIKAAIIADIQKDFNAASSYINKLPNNARKAVRISYSYYSHLLRKLAKTDARDIKQQRIRLSSAAKVLILIKEALS